MNRRRALDLAMYVLTALCTLVTVSVLLLILGYVVWQGGRSLNWAFFFSLPAAPGEAGGGAANAIAGSALLLGLAAAIGIPIGVLAGIFTAEFGGGLLARAARFAADLLNGVPSILLGIFAYVLIVLPMRRFSALAGAFALSLILMPIAFRTTEEFLRMVPQSLREAAFSLGASRWRAAVTVVVPAASRGIATGIVLGLARIAGETAPLMFTSFGNRFWSLRVDQPVASLPLMIFNFAISPYRDWHNQAWAAALLLLLVALTANGAVRLLLARNASRKD